MRRGRWSLAHRRVRPDGEAMTTDIRTGMTILGPDACWAKLRSAEVGRLAVSIVDQPDIFPINLVVDVTVCFRTAEGTKLAAAVLGRSVAFEVDVFAREGYEAFFFFNDTATTE